LRSRASPGPWEHRKARKAVSCRSQGWPADKRGLMIDTANGRLVLFPKRTPARQNFRT
jgi:hypothetical protein